MPSSSDVIQIGGNAGARLKSIVERIVRLEDEKKEKGQDIKEVYTEAKSIGFDTKILRKVVKRSQMDANQKHEEDDLLRVYEEALETKGNNLNNMMDD